MNFRVTISVLFVILKVILVECHYLPPSDPNHLACNGDRNASLVECPLTCMLTCYNALDVPGPCLRDCTGPNCECHPGYVLDVRALKCVLPKDCSDPPVVSCRVDEVFALCGACPRTCQTLREYPSQCELPCAWHACVCAQGLVRDAYGRCIPPDLCPLGIPPGSINPCGTNEEYSQCGTACPATCSNMEAGFPSCAPYCMAGCTCQLGYVRNSQNKCVSPSLCEVPPKCGRLEVWGLCTGCPVTCSLLRLPPAERPTCDNPCDTRGCICEPGLVRSDTGECVLPALCFHHTVPDIHYPEFRHHFDRISHVANTNGEKIYDKNHVIDNLESTSSEEKISLSQKTVILPLSVEQNNNNVNNKNLEIKENNVQYADFATGAGLDLSYEPNPIISIAKPITKFNAEKWEPKKEEENPIFIPILEDALEKRREWELGPLAKESSDKRKERESEEDNVQHADIRNLTNRESLFPSIELKIPSNEDISDSQNDSLLDVNSETPITSIQNGNEMDKIWLSRLPYVNIESSNTTVSTLDTSKPNERVTSENIKDSAHDLIQNQTTEMEENNVHDDDIVSNLSSVIDVDENTPIITENNTNGTTSNEGESLEDIMQDAIGTDFGEQRDSLLGKKENNLNDDLIWTSSSPNYVSGNYPILEENSTNDTTSNEGESTKNIVQDADVTDFGEKHDSSLDNNSTIHIDELIIPEIEIINDTREEILNNKAEDRKNNISTKECDWNADLGQSTTYLNDSDQHPNDKTMYENEPTITELSEVTRQELPLNDERIVITNPTSDGNMHADDIMHADEIDSSNQHDLFVDKDEINTDEHKGKESYCENEKDWKEIYELNQSSIKRDINWDETSVNKEIFVSTEESENEAKYDKKTISAAFIESNKERKMKPSFQNEIDRESNEQAGEEFITTPIFDEYNSKYVSDNLDDVNTTFDDSASCADDSQLCCECCECCVDSEDTSNENCEPRKNNSESSLSDTYRHEIPLDNIISLKSRDQSAGEYSVNLNTVENTFHRVNWQKEESAENSQAVFQHLSEQPVSCKGDPNALPGCGNYCGRTCNDYFIEDLKCSNVTCRVGACDCKEGFVLDVNSNKCVQPDDCTECGFNEYLDHCPSDCHVNCPYDITQEAELCSPEIDCPEPACVCMFNYRRDTNDDCVPIQQCPGLKCKGAHENYDPCPPADYQDKCKALHNHLRHHLKPPREIHECRPACLCADGYCRNIYGYCISKADH